MQEKFLSDFRNFNEIFSKEVTYDNIKVTKNQGFNLSLEHAVFEKPESGGLGQSEPPPFPPPPDSFRINLKLSVLFKEKEIPVVFIFHRKLNSNMN